jgi:hypothetical protein
VLQKVSREWTVFISASGDFIEYNLLPACHKDTTSNVAAWEATPYDIQSLGNKTAQFGAMGCS